MDVSTYAMDTTSSLPSEDTLSNVEVGYWLRWCQRHIHKKRQTGWIKTK